MIRLYLGMTVFVGGACGALWRLFGDVGVTLGFVVIALAGFLVMSVEAGRVQRGDS